MAVSRRRFIQTSATAAALAGIAGFYGPWKHNRAYAQGKPIKLGLTNDASGQFGNSGRDEHRGIRMAIDEVNAKGGVLGRKVEWVTADTESQPAVGTRVAERFSGGSMVAALGAIHRAGIPVMGHVGLTPQNAAQLGGLKVQGRIAEAARRSSRPPHRDMPQTTRAQSPCGRLRTQHREFAFATGSAG